MRITTVGNSKEGLMPVRILAVSGSLRAASSNTALLGATRALAPEGVEITLYDGLATLPHFNPDLDDLDAGTAPPEVANFRALLEASDGVLISSPEYAHGVPGAMKNAIDWVVSSGEIYEKPVALFNASMPGGDAEDGRRGHSLGGIGQGGAVDKQDRRGRHRLVAGALRGVARGPRCVRTRDRGPPSRNPLLVSWFLDSSR
jgi:hypothetical protein